MKKKNLFFGGLLMFAMAFSTVALIPVVTMTKRMKK